ncbi:MAG: dTDP-4-dehydrorhamnose reductase [Firmicutes bacterium]|nr:dTDP-4-dehydrorhamnose reductase [Bacillota bacterium]
MKILISGGNGQLARAVKGALPTDCSVFTPDRKELDVSSFSLVEDYFARVRPELVIHTAALTDVDRCEKEPGLALLVNARGSRNIALACQGFNAEMVHISTNFIFNGKDKIFYREDFLPDPINIYGYSKLLAEFFVKELLKNYYIVRTSWLYGEGEDNFVKRMLGLARQKKLLCVVDDQWAAPTYTVDLAEGILSLAASKKYGIYNMTNQGYCSRFQWVEEIIRISGIDVELKAVSSDYFPAPAVRPAFTVLSNDLLEQKIGFRLRSWEEALKEYCQRSGNI